MLPNRHGWLTAVMLLCLSVVVGCSQDASPILPDASSGIADAPPDRTTHVNSRACWGWWHVKLDTETMEFEVRPLRSAVFTCNVTRFMQPPLSPMHMVSFAIDPGASDFPNGLFAADVTLRHPFPGLAQYRGFDVHGIFMSDLGPGTLVTDQHDSTLMYPAWDGPRLLNADGYSRWWNYQEFRSYGTIFGYTPPAFEMPPGRQWYSELNGYKYFADELDKFSELDLDPERRGSFSTQSGVNSRRYMIQFGMDGGSAKIEFTYAVGASWSPPDPAFAPYYPVEAFDLNANCQEAYQIAPEIEANTLWYQDETNRGGDLSLSIEVFDWQATENPDGVPGEVSAIWLSSKISGLDPLDITPLCTVTSGSGSTSSVWSVDLADLVPYAPTDGYNRVLITVESSDPSSYAPDIPNPNDFDWPAARLAAFMWMRIPIGSEPPPPDIILTVPNGGELWQIGQEYDIEWIASPSISDVKLEYSKDGFTDDIRVIAESTPNTGSYTWEIPNDPSETVRVRVSEAGAPDNFDISDGDFTIYGTCEPELTEMWTYNFPGIERMNGSPTIADLDDDGTLEVLAFTHNMHRLHCFDHEGNMEWPPFTCSDQVASWYGKPAVAEFNGDGVLDVAVSNTNQSSPNGNSIWIVDGATGTEIFHIPMPFRAECMPSLADVVAADGNGPPDGQVDIFVGRNDVWQSNICYTACYNGANGNLVWETRREWYSLATPALADFDGDSIPDCLTGGGYYDEPPVWNGPHLLQGEANPDGDRLLWEADFGGNILGAPSLHDYTGDDIPDVIVGDHSGYSSTIRCLDGETGESIWWEWFDPNMANPALGDLNQDGYPDIVAFEYYDRVYAFNGDPDATERVLWIWTDPDTRHLDTRGSPTLYDVTCDGVPDVIACMVYNETPAQGIVWIIDGSTGTDIAHLDVPGDRIGWGAPAVGDIDNNGETDIVFGSYEDGVLRVYTLGTPVPVEYDARPWPMHMCNIRNTGLYGEEF